MRCFDDLSCKNESSISTSFAAARTDYFSSQKPSWTSDWLCLYFPPLLNLLALAVDKDFQGQGYGKALMQAIREEGVAAGYTGIRINSGISRMKAHEFYRKLGCEEKADQKRFYWEF